jgi:sulfatase modifying factor 1
MYPIGQRLVCSLVAVLGICGAGAALADSPADRAMALIPAGEYEPILRGKDDVQRVSVAAFWLDVRPVTNAEFLAFVVANPKWQRSHVKSLFADDGYLAEWAGDRELGARAPADSPVVRVSWFAARAYAASCGKRLPTTAEWEHAAAAGFASAAGVDEPAYRSAALGWFSSPGVIPLPAVGAGRPNFYGVRDLLTLVWEWVDDFNTALVTGESRADTGLERTLFCGAGSISARDLTNYPAFMRAGFRSSLHASYVVPNLGFRCARSTPPALTASQSLNLKPTT